MMIDKVFDKMFGKKTVKPIEPQSSKTHHNLISGCSELENTENPKQSLMVQETNNQTLTVDSMKVNSY